MIQKNNLIKLISSNVMRQLIRKMSQGSNKKLLSRFYYCTDRLATRYKNI